MQVSIWEVLGIEETDDARAIKRAYAAKLRIHSPEADPTGYMRLREAYEIAKRRAEFVRDTPESVAEPYPAPPEPTVPEIREPPTPSPQSIALIGLKELLAEHRLDDFLLRVDEIRNSGIFVTLDEQQDFIGEVAVLVHDSQVQDLEWCAKLAALFGAREHENVFDPGSDYWHAYQELLNAHQAVRQIAVRTRISEADEITKTPGYLHVFHVLTSPFDSERMTALTRSQTYYRLVESLLERAKKDTSIRIPAENREWWERTAMAGLHRPMAEPSSPPTPTPRVANDDSFKFPIWAIWPFLMIFITSFRACDFDTSGSSSRYGSSTAAYNELRMKEIRNLAEGKMPQGPPTTTELLLAENSPLLHLGGCDRQTHDALMALIERVPLDPNTESDKVTGRPYLKWKLVLDESKPEVAALLAKCTPATRK